MPLTRRSASDSSAETSILTGPTATASLRVLRPARRRSLLEKVLVAAGPLAMHAGKRRTLPQSFEDR